MGYGIGPVGYGVGLMGYGVGLMGYGEGTGEGVLMAYGRHGHVQTTRHGNGAWMSPDDKRGNMHSDSLTVNDVCGTTTGPSSGWERLAA